MNARNTWLGKPRKAIGAVRREVEQAEKVQAVEFEKLLRLHRCDYWHCTVAQASQPGWPDYVVLGKGWLAFVELKARRSNGSRGRVSKEQERYRDSIRAAAGEWVSFCWPDDIPETVEWLSAKTGVDMVLT